MLFFGVFAGGNLLSAQAEVSPSQIAGFLQDLTTRIEEIANAPVLKSSDSYVVEEYMGVMISQNPAIQQMAVIQPDGSIKIQVNDKGNSTQTGSVANESWFTAVCASKQPYNGVMRNEQGAVLLFRVWPLLGKTVEKKLIGLVTVKLDVRKYIQYLSGNKNEPLEILYGTTPLFSRNWNAAGADNILEDSFTFSVADKLVIRYRAFSGPPVTPESQAPPAPNEKIALQRPTGDTANAMTPDIRAIPPVNGKTTDGQLDSGRKISGDAATYAVAANDSARDETPTAPDLSKPGPAAANKVAESSKSATIQSWLSTDSIRTAGYVGSSDKRIVLFILLIAGLCFVIIFIITTIMVRRARRRRSEEKAREAMFKPDPVPSVMADNDATSLDKEDTRLLDKIPAVRPEYSGVLLDEVSHAERETKELPALREFIDDFLKKIHEVSMESNINQRNRVFEEINDDLNVWARSEIRQLSGRLGLLLQSIKECESKDGNSAELQVLRYEIMRIIKEVEDVEERLPQRNSVLIVS